jgi:hypothetical protein
VNPYSDDPILLVPQDYLRPLPTINPDDFWGYCYDTQTELLRRQFGSDITKRVSKEMIIEFAREHPDLRRRYIKTKESMREASHTISEQTHTASINHSWAALAGQASMPSS